MPKNNSYEFDFIVIELVDYYLRIRSERLKDLAMLLNVREDYVRKIHSHSNKKRYTLKQIYVIANAWGKDVSQFLPSIENLNNITKYKNYSLEEKIEILKEVENKILEADISE
ncbi:hypothetical protein [Mammaliicoccus sciuri]|uniref:hypothetical protein n=1 Tax=Mammaliicoccus sciuri TaxID=1296 RepID=UPI001C1E6424|nr:hypothetical protein [Mammaliicoccus sciuri]MBU6089456.1 hypothetical protein [Mammaliicoccus sciuri]MBW3109322.1 hypothetical protein [Mammaliicoccus sciuri]